MKLLTSLFQPMQHCENTVAHLCKVLNVKVTQSTLQKDLMEHPDYPSLASVGDVIQNYGIRSIGYKLSIDNFKEVPIPFLANIHAKKVPFDTFAVVQRIDSNSIEIYSPESSKNEILTLEEFSKIYSGYILAVEAVDNAGEKNFKRTKIKEWQKNFYNCIALFLLPVITLICCAISFFYYQIEAVYPIIFTILTLAGCMVGMLLIWHEIDEYNPLVQQICHASKKINCGAILNSDAAKIFGVSWSSLGSTYFIGMLLSLIVGGITNNANLFLLSWINIVALPYIIYSISYQWLVAKQWCILCLTVQAILFLQFVTAYLGSFDGLQSFAIVPVQAYLTIAGCFAIVFTTILILIPALEKAKESRSKTIALQRLKHDARIFDALLVKQKVIQHSTEGLGITIGKPDAKYKLVKVCNPYCGPCAKAHPIMDELVENNEELQIQILFTATGDENDIKTPPALHLLAIAAKGDEQLTKQALDDWYLAEKKDYTDFASRYPLNGELSQQTEKVKAMNLWCEKTEISFTPTFFVNGHQLPEMYSVADLKYFLTV